MPQRKKTPSPLVRFAAVVVLSIFVTSFSAN